MEIENILGCSGRKLAAALSLPMREEKRLQRLSQDINELREFWKIRIHENMSYLVLEDVFLGRPFRPRTIDLVIFIPPFYPLLFPTRFAISSELRKGNRRISNNKPLQGWVIVELPINEEHGEAASLKDFLLQAFLYLDRI